MIPGALLAMAMAMAVTSPPPFASAELLAIDPPDDFVVGNHQRSGGIEILELVRPPETVNDWSTMVTSMIIADQPRLGMFDFNGRWLRGMKTECPRGSAQVLDGTVDGAPALRTDWSCPDEARAGRLEQVTAFLIRGSNNLMMVQVATRRPFTAADENLIARVANSLKICDQRKMDVCSGRQATGFRQAR